MCSRFNQRQQRRVRAAEYLSQGNSDDSCKEIGVQKTDDADACALEFLKDIVCNEKLHLAVITGDLPAVKYLVSNGADINLPANNANFNMQSKSSHDSGKLALKYRDYGYYGDFPLTFAAIFNHTEIYDYLLKKGADPNAQDSRGNTVLHLIVIHNQLGMFSYAMRHPYNRANPWIKNNDGLTAVSLCCQLGLSEMFNEIMELSRIEIWKFSDLECSLYPLTSLDSIGSSGCTDRNSALISLVNGNAIGHLEILHHPVVQQIINEKWRVFVKRRFVLRLATALGHLCLMSTTVYLRKSGYTTHRYIDYKDAIRFAAELIYLGGTASTFLMHVNEIKENGFKNFMTNLKNVPTKLTFLLGCVLVFLVAFVRVAMWSLLLTADENQSSMLLNAEETCWILVVILEWPFLLFFLTCHHLFGPLIITFYMMVARDVTRVMIILVVFWLTAAAAFKYLYKDSGMKEWATLDNTIISVFQMILGSSNSNEFKQSRIPELASVLFALAMIFIAILLLNMLIAAMGNTFNAVQTRSKQEWFSQFAKLVLTLERAFAPKLLQSYQKNYSIEIYKYMYDSRYQKDHKGILNYDSTAVISSAIKIIRKVPNTKAFVRKRAHKNWKWLIEAVKTLIKNFKAHSPNKEASFANLFGVENYEDDVIRQKMLALNLRTIKLEKIKDRANSQSDLAELATQLRIANI